MARPRLHELGGGATAFALALAGLTFGGCGGGEAAEQEPPTATAGKTVPAAATQPRPAARRPLEFPERGNRIVWVRLGERIGLHERPGGKRIGWARERTQWQSRTVFAVRERRGRWVGVLTPKTANGELAWVRLDPRRLRAGAVPWEIQVDLSAYRTKLLRNGRVVRSFPVSVGGPGTETPTGTFAVTDTFRGDLNPAYGCCAVALTARQPRLPSGWLGGDRIAIHATQGSIGTATSNGCVRATDPEVSALVDRVPPGTPVVIRQ